ncbi:Uncharacterized protein Adt_42464 [Abeliophyllum distichum]|uniref:Uncharacterized protein n=1 Tax=Abeliophyllum distichum TaxID=126358 RepID=A0ABD1PTD3_9LAMI
MDQGRRPRPTLAKLAKQRPKILGPGSVEDASQRNVVEDLSRVGNKEVAGASRARGSAVEVDNTVCGASPLQRTLVVNPSGEVVLEGPSRPTPTPESRDGGPFDSKRRLQELIGALGARIPDDVLRNLPFYPSMGPQAVKKYFTPK